jgi:hypothetical protein
MQEGSNNLQGYDLGFANCGNATAGGAMKFQSLSPGNFGQYVHMMDLQIDGCGVSPIYINANTSSRDYFVFDGLQEFENGSATIHRQCYEIDMSSSPNTMIDIANVGTLGGDGTNVIIKETGTSSAN